MNRSITHLPDLRPLGDGVLPRPVCGWYALQTDRVSVPGFHDAERCAGAVEAAANPCEVRATSFDPPNRTTIIRLPASGKLTVRATVLPSFPLDEEVPTEAGDEAAKIFRDHIPVLVIQSQREGDSFRTEIPGAVTDSSRRELVFEWEVPYGIASGLGNGFYGMAVKGFEADGIVVNMFLTSGPGSRPMFSADPCAVTLTPEASSAGMMGKAPQSELPRPPLLAVDSSGRILSAWSVDGNGHVLVPSGESTVLVQASCQGGIIASLQVVSGSAPQVIRDAVFWKDHIAVLTSQEVRVFNGQGCPASPATIVSDLNDAVALAVSEEGSLIVVSGSSPNMRMFRRDGSEVMAPVAYAGRGFFARQRSAALAFDSTDCTYWLKPRLMGAGCCADGERKLTETESRLFEDIDNLGDLRKRIAYPLTGEVVLGPEREMDPLDSGRPGTQWHRILLFGEIPKGCAVQVETRASDDLLAGDPLVSSGWSRPTSASASSAVMVASPGDTREAAASVMVLAKQGRFLWIRLTLRSNGVLTPRITAIEAEQPRQSIVRYLPKFIQNSTPEDDFLRRWLALFEDTVFGGVAERLDSYAELFDPRRAPTQMLPFLAGWLRVLEIARLNGDEQAFRNALLHAAELAQTRGTIDGLLLAARIYMGINIQIVESYKRSSAFILGLGPTMDGITGPALGCHTILSSEPGPTWLGDSPQLGTTFLFDCETRGGTIPYQFEVLVAARDVCRSEDLALLKKIIDTEKPAWTSFSVREIGANGWVVGNAILGQTATPSFDRNELDPDTFGILVQNGPPRPRPIGQGFTLGAGSRLAGTAQETGFRVGANVGRTTHL